MPPPPLPLQDPLPLSIEAALTAAGLLPCVQQEGEVEGVQAPLATPPKQQALHPSIDVPLMAPALRQHEVVEEEEEEVVLEVEEQPLMAEEDAAAVPDASAAQQPPPDASNPVAMLHYFRTQISQDVLQRYRQPHQVTGGLHGDEQAPACAGPASLAGTGATHTPTHNSFHATCPYCNVPPPPHTPTHPP
jgi:hypothetical protein